MLYFTLYSILSYGYFYVLTFNVKYTETNQKTSYMQI